MDVLELFQCHRVVGSHLLYADILENDIRWTVQLLADLLAQVFQHGAQCRIQCAGAAFMVCRRVVVLAELMVFDNHERDRVLQEFLASRCQLQQSVVLNVFLQVTGNECLSDDGVPELLVFVLAGTEKFVVLVLVGQDFFRISSLYKVDDVFCAEILFEGMDGIQDDDQQLLGFNLGLRVQAVVTVVAVVLCVFLTEIV